MASKVSLEYKRSPVPHYLVSGSQKKLHGWYNRHYRECTSERLIVNPYCGCQINCFFCYAKALPGYFSASHRQGNPVYVFKDFDRQVRRQLDSLAYASCGYLSAVSDPFQKINDKYRMSEKIIRAFVDYNVPIEVVTKQRIPDEAIELLSRQSDSFAQISVLTIHEKLRGILSPGSATVEDTLDTMRRLRKNSIYCAGRIDPILPYITDDQPSLLELIETLAAGGVSHIVASVMDIPLNFKRTVLAAIKLYWGSAMEQRYQELYTERIGGCLHAAQGYREGLFSWLSLETKKRGMSFSLCMEFKRRGAVLSGMNIQYSSSRNCEGKDVPVYRREGSRFNPIVGCKGNCLRCDSFVCGLSRFNHKSGKTCLALTLKDYKYLI